MLTGKIFEDITGLKASELHNTEDIWNAVVAARPTDCSCLEYSAGIVSKRGGVFRLVNYDFDIDKHIEEL